MKKYIIKFLIPFLLIIIIPLMILHIFKIIDKPRNLPTYNIENNSIMLNNINSMQGKPQFLPQPIPAQPEHPPIAVPFLVIIFGGLLLSYIYIKDLRKNIISPANKIINNLREIRNGTAEVEFSTNTDNETVIKMTETLDEMFNALKENEILRNNFVKELSHDLRSPVLSQDKAIEILVQEYPENEILQLLKQSNKDYLKLLNLLIETYTNDKFKSTKEKFLLNDIVDNVLLVLAPSIEMKNMHIYNNLKQNIEIYSDFTAINRVFLNLLSNEIENLSEDKNIEISCDIKDKSYTIFIQDNGQGIKEEYLSHIFDKKPTMNKTGQKLISGLGLGITKRLIEENGGNINVESEYGKYTKFVIQIPKGFSKNG